jgi:signal transduction histidine kinase
LEGVHVVMDYNDSIPNIPLDRSQMRQVFMNLINNAMDAMSDKDNKELLIKIEKLCDSGGKASHLLVAFSDRGCGIQPEVISHLFDPFFTTKETGKGTGLGLSISHGIIRNHGGRIWAENNSQGGATFYIELPLLAMTSANHF